jgi:hypothetical protein
MEWLNNQTAANERMAEEEREKEDKAATIIQVPPPSP